MLKKNLLRLFVIFVIASGTGTLRAEEERLLGQGNDGNRSGPVHVLEVYDDQGRQIHSADKNPQPFSMKQTCGQCHNYEMIASGWHFNAHNSNVDTGRPGQPWVLTEPMTRTQIPITARKWDGTFAPEELGITPWEFVKMNFSHFPGGSYGEMESQNPDEAIRQQISGQYEINCLTCHHADPRQDQSAAAMQAARQNYRWIAAESSGKAIVSGIASSLDDFFDPEFDEGLKVTYEEGVFDSENKIFFDITNRVSNERCYFCHSNHDLAVSEANQWTRDEDVHLKSGLLCVDCHRNGDDHMITRGIETEGPGKTLSCEGCHTANHSDKPERGRLGAPKPQHRGIPTVHFEKLTCTACHSGTWPTDLAKRWRTARIHKTGLHGKHNLNLSVPHVYAPVLMKRTDGKIGPHKIFWPAYWAVRMEGQVTPLSPARVLEKAKQILNTDVEKVDDWRPLTKEQIQEVLIALAPSDGEPVYIASGLLYYLDAKGSIVGETHDAAKPYAWPMAHDVRPAEQSLGIRNCQDCHIPNSNFFFGKVQVDTPVKATNGPEYVEMTDLQGIDRIYIRAFNASFIFRPFLKIIAFASCGLIGLVILTYCFKAVTTISNVFAAENE